MFQRVFEIIERLTGRRIRWRHLHNEGIIAVISDMGGGQIKGMTLHILLPMLLANLF
jgi:hypothetical protein